MMDNFCNLCVIITIFCFMYTIFSMSQYLSGNEQAYTQKLNDGFYKRDRDAYYGICMDGFGDHDDESNENDLNVLDMTILTRLAYEANEYDLCEVIDAYFNGTYKMIKIHRNEPFYFHIRHKRAPIDIIAIRGTSDTAEMIQDVSLFVEVALYEFLQCIVPFLNAFPISFTRQILYYSAYSEGILNPDARAEFDDPVYDYAQAYMARLESDCTFDELNDTEIENWKGPTSMYFVGHSLGGGISQIVAANLYEDHENLNLKSNIQSYGVCSPGTLMSSAKFGFSVTALDVTASSLLPRRDVISMVDEHGGSVQYTECDADEFASCHYLESVLCELF